jgi:integrase
LCGNGKARRYARSVAEAIRDRLRRGRGPQTAAHYLSAIKQFTRWLVKDRRTLDNALAHLTLAGAQADLRHDRRALTEDELRALLDITKVSAVTYRGLTGQDRQMLYAVAAATGFRKGELASLTPDAFALDSEPPCACTRTSILSGTHSFACLIRAAQH